MVCAVDNRSYIVDVECWSCRNVYSIILNKEDLVDFHLGSGPIEKVFYYLSRGERELLISNTCDSCFDSLFPPLDNDD